MKKIKILVFLLLCTTMNVYAQSEMTKLKLEKVVITKMAFVNSHGTSWDKNSGADIYITVKDYRDNLIENTRKRKQKDVTLSDLPLEINLEKSIIYQTNAPFSLTINDADAFSDDLMKTIKLEPSNFPPNSKQPDKPYIYTDEKGVYEISIIYVWQK